MNFVSQPELLPIFIEAIEKDFNFLANIFAEETDEVSFDTLYAICEDANVLKIFEVCPSGLKTPRRVRHYYTLLTEIVLLGAKKIWTNPHNGIKKQISGLFLTSILYANQPMPGQPVKIPLEAKELFCVIEQLHVMLVNSVQNVPNMKFMCVQASFILKRLLLENAFEFVVKCKYYNLAPHNRTIMDAYETMDLLASQNRAMTKEQNVKLTYFNGNNCLEKVDGAHDKNKLSTSKKKKKCRSQKLRNKSNSSSSDQHEILNTLWKGDPLAASKEVLPNSNDICPFTENDIQESDESEGSESSQCEEDSDSDGLQLLLSGTVPKIEEAKDCTKTAANLHATEEALKFLTCKSLPQSQQTKSSVVKSETKLKRKETDFSPNKSKSVDETCAVSQKNKKNPSKDDQNSLPEEFLKLMQAADESVKLAYGITEQAKRMDEKKWLSKDVKDGTKALNIFALHKKGNLEKSEGIRFVTKSVSSKDSQVFVERVNSETDEDIFITGETNSSIKRMLNNSPSETCEMDPILYQRKYLNNYNHQLKLFVEGFYQHPNTTDKWADRFVKRFRTDNVINLGDEQRNVKVKNFLTEPKPLAHMVELSNSRKPSCEKQIRPVSSPIKEVSSDDVEMTEELDGKSFENSTNLEDSVFSCVMLPSIKDVALPCPNSNVKMEVLDNGAEYVAMVSVQAENSCSSKVLSMPNLDSLFGL